MVPMIKEKKDKAKSEDKDEKSKLEKELFVEKKSAWQTLEKEEIKEAYSLAREYKRFLDSNKTEREIVSFVEGQAKKAGYIELEKATSTSKKIYAKNHEKNILLVDLSGGELKDGARILGSHIDTLRLDFKLSPIYESEPFAMINSHYYGGIKKYQWLNVPLALHGVIFDKNGKKIDITIGEEEEDPVFVISDLLPHLEGNEGKEKCAKDIIKGEELDAIAGTVPIDDKKVKEKIKANFLKVLNDKYNITEHDFASAELGLYPATKARDVGLDGGMIGAPAHDDRICAFLSVKAILEGKLKHAAIVLLVDKEEIGSVGNTSMDSLFLENALTKIINLRKDKTTARDALEKSKAISADVTSAYDTKFADKMDPMNMNKPGYGVAVEKYTGSGGKYYGSDANAEYMSFIRRMLDASKIPWQHGEIGKVDQGGGGTIAYMLAKYNLQIIDMGTPVLAMHSPFEIASKIDTYCTLKAYKAFFAYA